MKVLVELEIEVDPQANFLSSTTDKHLEDIKDELLLMLYDIDDIDIQKIYLEEL